MVLDNVIASIIRRALGLEMNRKKYIQVPNTRPDQGDSLLLAPWRLVATSGKHVRAPLPRPRGFKPPPVSTGRAVFFLCEKAKKRYLFYLMLLDSLRWG